MPNPNAIVSTTIRFEPPLEGRKPDEVVATEGQAVDLGDGRRIRLNPDDRRSVGFVQVLDGLATTGRPAYIEIDPATQSIDRLLIPTIGRVTSVQPRRGDAGGIEVTLDRSHARHRLPAGGDDAPELETALRAAFETRRPVLVVEDFDGAIIDVLDYTPEPGGPRPPLPEPGDPDFPPLPPGLPPLPPRKPWWQYWILWPFRRLWWWFWYPWWWLKCPSKGQARAIFDAMAATSCDPLTVPVPCIPFLYPDNGCWARASEMCRLMIAMGREPAKVWIDGDLEVISTNKPGCLVEWSWHVAPTICRRGGRWPWGTERVVIDPSLFAMPVTEADWKAKQGDPAATLTDTDHTVYWRNVIPTDPTYYWTALDLADYRLALFNRSNQVGPPPYVCP
jgi:hypothetical protein